MLEAFMDFKKASLLNWLNIIDYKLKGHRFYT
jgi:hypothetical protein